MKEIIVIKLGGVAATSITPKFIKIVKEWQSQGKQIVIVHGGGFVIDDLMANCQLPIEKQDGLRVTSKKAMICVEQGLCQIVGPSLTQTLNDADLDALQIYQKLPQILNVDYLDQVRYGQVGTVTGVSLDYITKLLDQGIIPVLPSMGQTEDGEWLNINADDVASQLAVGLQAEQLIMMTDVAGVKESGNILEQLTPQDVTQKIDSGIITGNMIPKVLGATQAVLSGVGRVSIGQTLYGGTHVLKGA
ncbi:acetylglutamate kinase [Streptococcus rifensis]